MANYKHYIGETFTAKNGMKFTIINIDRTSKKPYIIQFEDGYTTSVFGGLLKNRAKIRNNNLIRFRTKMDRTGEQNRHRDGSLMTIIRYEDAANILVEFDDYSVSKCNYDSFIKGICVHKIRIFGVDYNSIRDVRKHFGINEHTVIGKSSIEIEEYITNNRIEYNGQWVSITNYLKAHGIIPVNFYEYLRVNNIEKNAVNVKRYIPQYLEITENKITTVHSTGDTLKIINNCFETSFKSLKGVMNHFDLGYSNISKFIGNGEGLIEYIKQHSIQYGNQWISIKSYCEKLGIEYGSLKAWAKTKHIRINASNIIDAIKNYRNDITIESQQQRVYEMQKLEQLIKRYRLNTYHVRKDQAYDSFRRNNISAEQVIVHFRPDLHINIFGKIVDENGNEV